MKVFVPKLKFAHDHIHTKYHLIPKASWEGLRFSTVPGMTLILRWWLSEKSSLNSLLFNLQTMCWPPIMDSNYCGRLRCCCQHVLFNYEVHTRCVVIRMCMSIFLLSLCTYVSVLNALYCACCRDPLHVLPLVKWMVCRCSGLLVGVIKACHYMGC